MLTKLKCFAITEKVCLKHKFRSHNLNKFYSSDTKKVGGLQKIFYRNFSDNLPVIKEENKIDQNDKTLQTISKVDSSLLKKETYPDLIKYKVFEDSIAPTIEALKAEVPEIAKHFEFRQYIDSLVNQDKQEEVLRKEGLVILKNKLDPFHKYSIDTYHYRNYHDKDYEVDIQEILTKDLFEKQRVVDNYVEENKSKINDLMGYYNNVFQYLKFNKYTYLIYQNNYLKSMTKLKIKLIANLTSVGALSALVCYLNPFLLLLLLPEYYGLIYMFNLMNNLVDQVILLDNKQSVKLRTFNLLGFRREYPKMGHDMLKLRYDGKFKNNVLNLNDKGLFFTTRLLRKFWGTKSNKDKDGEKDKELDNFKHFHILRTLGKYFYIPADLSKQHGETNEELILNLLNGEVKAMREYDFSDYEDRAETAFKLIEEYKKEYAKKSHSNYTSKEDIIKSEYSQFKGNRDYSDAGYDLTLKRTDGVDGTFVNNGYR